MPEHDTAHWGYVEPIDPAHWGDLDPAYALCKLGQCQSPIDLCTATEEDAEPIIYDYRPTDLRILNNGHTVQVQCGGPNTITLEGECYTLVQYHLHAPSEHTVQGERAAMELHLVHQSQTGALAVVGVLMQPGPENTALDCWWCRMPAEVGGAEQDPTVLVDPADLLPKTRRAWRYTGSLTTPPGSEGVQWVVLTEPLLLSQAQIDAFCAIINGNVRPTQPLNGRVVRIVEG